MNFLKITILASLMLMTSLCLAQGTLDKVTNDICKQIEQVDKKLSEEAKNKKVENITKDVFIDYSAQLIDEYNIDLNDVEASFEKLGIEVAKRLMDKCDGFIALLADSPKPKSNKKTVKIIDKMTKDVCKEIQNIDMSLSVEDKTAELELAILAVFFENYKEVIDAYNIKNPEESDIFESIGVELGINLAKECDGFLNVYK